METSRCKWCREIVTGQDKCGCEAETEIHRLQAELTATKWALDSANAHNTLELEAEGLRILFKEIILLLAPMTRHDELDRRLTPNAPAKLAAESGSTLGAELGGKT